jgi:hypothetical protein
MCVAVPLPYNMSKHILCKYSRKKDEIALGVMVRGGRSVGRSNGG